MLVVEPGIGKKNYHIEYGRPAPSLVRAPPPLKPRRRRSLLLLGEGSAFLKKSHLTRRALRAPLKKKAATASRNHVVAKAREDLSQDPSYVENLNFGEEDKRNEGLEEKSRKTARSRKEARNGARSPSRCSSCIKNDPYSTRVEEEQRTGKQPDTKEAITLMKDKQTLEPIKDRHKLPLVLGQRIQEPSRVVKLYLEQYTLYRKTEIPKQPVDEPSSIGGSSVKSPIIGEVCPNTKGERNDQLIGEGEDYIDKERLNNEGISSRTHHARNKKQPSVASPRI
ncbi:hypothetical protein DH2020_045502 [Rehmannia glutinosa]|uniref:Uncharacterized protein n=1 Tax=Rehmannia glutinosa TaxID=99300 RepID=A0ABR0UE46_REHGL